MTAISHLDPAFSDVFSIQAINEPIMDARQTPGYGECKCLMLFSEILVLTLSFDFQSRRISYSPYGLWK